MKYLLLITLIFFIGCDSSSTNSESLGYEWTSDQVKEVKLSDGTPCAVFQGFNGGGITCDWNKK